VEQFELPLALGLSAGLGLPLGGEDTDGMSPMAEPVGKRLNVLAADYGEGSRYFGGLNTSNPFKFAGAPVLTFRCSQRGCGFLEDRSSETAKRFQFLVGRNAEGRALDGVWIAEEMADTEIAGDELGCGFMTACFAKRLNAQFFGNQFDAVLSTLGTQKGVERIAVAVAMARVLVGMIDANDKGSQ